MNALSAKDKIRIRAAVNEWVSSSFPEHRRHLRHWEPKYCGTSHAWSVVLGAKGPDGHPVRLGEILVSDDAEILETESVGSITVRLERLLGAAHQGGRGAPAELRVRGGVFRLGDGVTGSQSLADREIDLLLTDPPYGISKAYTCEKQVPRRLRKDGRDFIMPRGSFGDWDVQVEPRDWLEPVLPKVGGWFVSFCAQAQIGEYQRILSEHRFNSIGAMVWQKTNPVPFNHRFKPINAWEAIVIGKRPGTKFHGAVVHNVFRCKSPSPQTRVHPTQKPLGLMEDFIGMFSAAGALVYDPFSGSGTTVMAAARLKRRCIGYERDEEIFIRACERLEEADK